MPAPIRFAALPVAALMLVGVGFGTGVSQAQDAPPGESEDIPDIEAMVEDCQRHMEAMAPMMENMAEMTEMMGASGMGGMSQGMRR